MTDNLNRQTVRYRQSALQKWQVFEFLHDKNLLISASLADINPAPQLYGFPLKIFNTKYLLPCTNKSFPFFKIHAKNLFF